MPLGSAVINGPGHYKSDDYPYDDPPNGQFGAAERICDKRGITREQLDEWGFHSQRKAKQAWDEGRYEREVAVIQAPVLGDDGQPTGETTPDLARPGPARHHDGDAREPASGGRGLPATPRAARRRSPTARPRCSGWTRTRPPRSACGPGPDSLHQLVTGTDPYYLLDGPVDATTKMLARSGMAMSDFDIFEINEAFGSVVLSWAQVHEPDLDRVNVNGGAIALGHPVGSTGARLFTTALHELERTDAELAFVTMCCGGSLGTASILQRI